METATDSSRQNIKSNNSALKTPLSFSDKLKIKKANLLSAYYGRPIEDINLIIFAGKNRDLSARITHGALTALGQNSHLLSTKIAPTAGTIHKFLSDTWKKGATFGIVATPVFSLTNLAFYGLPVKIFSLTSELPEDATREIIKFCQTNSAFTRPASTEPMKINLWQDQTPTTSSNILTAEPLATLKITTMGFAPDTDISLKNLKNYKQGTEATITCAPDQFKIATFDTSENIAESLLSATSALLTLGYSSADITDAIADWDTTPEGKNR